MDFADDPFKDYRYEDPFNIEDPFADVTDSKRQADPFGRPTSVAGFETDDFFSPSIAVNGVKTERRGGRVSAPPLPSAPVHASDPFASQSTKPAGDTWSAWPNDNWAADDAWANNAPQDNWKTDAWANKADTWNPKSDNWNAKSDNWNAKSDNWNAKSDDWNNAKSDNWNKSDNWSKSDNWAAEWGGTDQNKNLNETWPTNTLPAKKEKSPKPVKYAKSLVHTIGGIGRTKHKEKKAKAQLEARSTEAIPSEEQQWAWATAASKRLEMEAEQRRRQEDAELQLALAISRQEK